MEKRCPHVKKKSKESESVSATVELSGEYEEIVDIISTDESEHPKLTDITEDMGVVLDVITRTGGATKSQIPDEAPSNATVAFDGSSVIHVLRVLELYDLVHLDGNTWRSGPALSEP